VLREGRSLLSVQVKSAKQRKKTATREELQVARALGGRRTFNSGAGDFEKGDGVVAGLFAIENKTTASDSYRLSGKDYQKIHDHARGKGLEPLFIINMALIQNTSLTGRVVVIRAGYAQVLGVYSAATEAPTATALLRASHVLEDQDHGDGFDLLGHGKVRFELCWLSWELFLKARAREEEGTNE